MNNVKQLLMSAKALIQDPNNWTQHVLARDGRNNLVSIASDDACKYCAEGAAMKVTAHSEGHIWEQVRYALYIALPLSAGSVVAYNDTHTHEEVLALFDRAIAAQAE